MAEQKPPNIHAVLNEIIEHTVAIEEENFYFRQALSFAKANPTEYGFAAQKFEQCLAIVQAAPERFDHSSAFVPYQKLRERSTSTRPSRVASSVFEDIVELHKNVLYLIVHSKAPSIEKKSLNLHRKFRLQIGEL